MPYRHPGAHVNTTSKTGCRRDRGVHGLGTRLSSLSNVSKFSRDKWGFELVMWSSNFGHSYVVGPLAAVCLQRQPYVAVLVVEVDDQSEGSASHWFGGDEGVLERRLSAGRNQQAQLEGCEVLDVELEILGFTETKQNHV